MMSFILRVAPLTDLWRFLMPSAPEPRSFQIRLWLQRYTDEELERAVTRVASKFNAGKLPADIEIIGRYVSGVLANERQLKAGVNRAN